MNGVKSMSLLWQTRKLLYLSTSHASSCNACVSFTRAAGTSCQKLNRINKYKHSNTSVANPRWLSSSASSGTISPPENLLRPLELPSKTLMGPGPSNCPPRVLKASSLPMLGHLHPEFTQVCTGYLGTG